MDLVLTVRRFYGNTTVYRLYGYIANRISDRHGGSPSDHSLLVIRLKITHCKKRRKKVNKYSGVYLSVSKKGNFSQIHAWTYDNTTTVTATRDGVVYIYN